MFVKLLFEAFEQNRNYEVRKTEFVNHTNTEVEQKIDRLNGYFRRV